MNNHSVQSGEDSGEYDLPQWYALVNRESQDALADRSAAHQKGNRLTVYQGTSWQKMLCFGPDDLDTAFFEGYLFDREPLISRLDLPDTADYVQIVAQAYLRWGVDMFEHLDGAYLAAIWDEEKQRFVIGHDGLSKHPVYYTISNEGFWFASNILALAHSGAVEPVLNRLSLARRLVLQHPLAGQTFFANIRRLLPGSFLTYCPDGSTSEHRYWQPIPEEWESYYSEEQVLGEYREVLQSAVDRTMVVGGDGILLSGGVDSISVAILATKYTSERNLPPVSACVGTLPPGFSSTSESELQGPVAHALGMPFEPSDATQWLNGESMLWRSLAETTQLPGPTHIYWTGAYMGFYRLLRANGHRMLLSGSGGDEWLGVHEAIAADYVRKLSIGRLNRLIRMRQRQDLISRSRAAERILWHAGIKRHLASYRALILPTRTENNLRSRIRAQIPPWLILDNSLRDELVSSIYDSYTHPVTKEGRKPGSYYWHALRSSFQNPWMTYEMERRFQVSGCVGIRLSSPFHDRQVIDFFRRVDPQTLLYAHRSKGLLRNLAAENLPGLGLERQAKTYGNLDAAFTTVSLKQQLEPVGRLAGSKRVDGAGLVDGQIYESALFDSAGNSVTEMVTLFAVMSTESWLGCNGIGVS